MIQYDGTYATIIGVGFEKPICLNGFNIFDKSILNHFKEGMSTGYPHQIL
jgi:hypothetical protein